MWSSPRAYFLLLFWIFQIEALNPGPKEKQCLMVPMGGTCKAFYYKDCKSELLKNQYPYLYYNPENVTIATPNLTIATKEARDHLGNFTSVNVTIYPAQETEEWIQGFEVRLTSIEGVRCVVVAPDHNGSMTVNERKSGFSFKLALIKSINISALSLPTSTASQPVEKFVLAGKTIEFPSENSSMWYTKIWFVNKSRDQTVEVQFQPAPAGYGIQYYNIHLRQIKHSGYLGVSSRTTTHAKMEFSQTSCFYVKFKGVEPGTYKVKVEPYDDLAGDDAKCRCKMNGRCQSCRPTETPEFVMKDTRPSVSTPEVNTESEIITSKSYDIINVFNDQADTKDDVISFKDDELASAIMTSGSEAKFPILGSQDVKTHIMSSKSPATQDNQGEGFEGLGDTDNGQVWKVSVLSVLGVAIGALVSVFAVVKLNKKRVNSNSASPVKIQTGSHPDILIIHDTQHTTHAQNLINNISQHMKHVTTGARLNSHNNLSRHFRSHPSIIILWMTQKNFTDFERRLLKDKKIPLSKIQRRFVIIESEDEGCSIQPRIQYRTKFNLNADLDVFLDFLRCDVRQESQPMWSSDLYPSSENKITTQPLQRHYSRMDSGIHSDFENEADSTPLEPNVEKQSMAAVTIAEGHLEAPPQTLLIRPKQLLASHPTVPEYASVIMPEDTYENYSDWHYDSRDQFLSPDAISNFDTEGSMLSEAIMHLNDRNNRPSDQSNHPYYPTYGRPGIPRALTLDEGQNDDTPVCFEIAVTDDEEMEDPDKDHVPAEGVVRLGRDDISVGGHSC